MGKRRNAAKTGDKKLYSRRQELSNSTSPKKSVQQSMDEWQDERDESYLALSPKKALDDPADDPITAKHHILDLGVSDDSSDEGNRDDDDEGDSDEESALNDKSSKQLNKDKSAPLESESDSDDDSEMEDDAEDLEQVDPRNWGRKKSAYYDADTGDLEIGQDEDDAFVEEAAAREVQTSRFEEMDQDDFVLSDNDDNDDAEESPSEPKKEKLVTERDISQLPLKQRRKFLKLQHPELIPVATHFAEVLSELKSSTNVAVGALFQNRETAESVGTSKQGLIFLLTKAMIEQSISLNTAMYLLVKSFLVEDDETAQDIDSHPVMLQLKMASVLMQKLVDNTVKKTANLDEQVKSLVKAAALLVDVGEDMQENNVNQNAKPTQGKRKSLVVESDTVQTPTPAKSVDLKPNSRSRQGVLDEVRFGLREHEIDQKTKLKRRKAPVFSDLGDSNDDGTASRSLAATINAIDQRAAAKSKKRKPEKSTEDTDFHEEDFEVTDGIRRMEDELEGTHQMDSLQDSAGEATDDSGDHLMDEGDDDMNFYKIMAEKSKRKKQIKEQMHQVAPKFPTMESEVSGERAINRTILKNRGLVAHKAKINRNPRVKKRMQYRKALIRRKGAVREIRTEEGHKYDGEGTGIKSRITRSRKLV